MDVKGEALLQLLNRSKLRNGTKTFPEPKFSLLIVKFKKLGFSAPLRQIYPQGKRGVRSRLINMLQNKLYTGRKCGLNVVEKPRSHFV